MVMVKFREWHVIKKHVWRIWPYCQRRSNATLIYTRSNLHLQKVSILDAHAILHLEELTAMAVGCWRKLVYHWAFNAHARNGLLPNNQCSEITHANQVLHATTVIDRNNRKGHSSHSMHPWSAEKLQPQTQISILKSCTKKTSFVFCELIDRTQFVCELLYNSAFYFTISVYVQLLFLKCLQHFQLQWP